MIGPLGVPAISDQVESDSTCRLCNCPMLFALRNREYACAKRTSCSNFAPVQRTEPGTRITRTHQEGAAKEGPFRRQRRDNRSDCIGAQRSGQAWCLGRDAAGGRIVSHSGGSCSTATSRLEPDPERSRSNGLGWRQTAKVVDQHETKPSEGSSCRSAGFQSRELLRKISRMCLAVPRLSSPCLPTPTSPRDWIVLARTQLGFGESASTVLSLCKRFSIRRPASKRPSSFSHSRTKFASFYRIQHGKPWPLGMVAACNRMALSGAETMRACLICCSWPSIPRLRAI